VHFAKSYVVHPFSAAAEGKDGDVIQGYDIAVIKLRGSKYFPKAQVCLAGNPSLNRQIVSAMGFGEVGNGQPTTATSNAMKLEQGQTNTEVGVARLRNRACSYQTLNDYKHGSTFTCAASGLFRTDSTCPGDSGGPVVENLVTSPHKPALIPILGVNSFGWGHGCGARMESSAYIEVFKVRQWITSKAPRFRDCVR